MQMILLQITHRVLSLSLGDTSWVNVNADAVALAAEAARLTVTSGTPMPLQAVTERDITTDGPKRD